MIILSALALFASGRLQAGFEPGASLRLYQTPPNVVAMPSLVAGQTPNIDRLIRAVNVPNGTFGMDDNFYVEVTGEINVAVAGVTGFRLTSDDGSILLIDGQEVLDNDGIHPATPQEGSTTLTAGWHPFKIRYFEAGGQEELRLDWKPAGAAAFTLVDDTVIRTPKGETRVISPGVKAIKYVGGTARAGNGMPLEGPNPSVIVKTIRPENFSRRFSSSVTSTVTGRSRTCSGFHLEAST
jgi:hypothetical protein